MARKGHGKKNQFKNIWKCACPKKLVFSMVRMGRVKKLISL
jgi:hypothetical protein